MQFIEVTAKQCNAQGQTDPQTQRTKLRLNVDLVAAIIGLSVLLKGGDRVNLGGKWYRDIQATSPDYFK